MKGNNNFLNVACAILEVLRILSILHYYIDNEFWY